MNEKNNDIFGMCMLINIVFIKNVINYTQAAHGKCGQYPHDITHRIQGFHLLKTKCPR